LNKFNIRKIYNIFAIGILKTLPLTWINKFADELLRLRLQAQELVRQKVARSKPEVIPHIFAFDGDKITRSILEKHPTWNNCKAPECSIPGMLSEVEKLYYTYITKFYSGLGYAVEVGPWLGLSTYFILSGLLSNPNFFGKRLYVYDDFTWRSSWMNKWLTGTHVPLPLNHSSFKGYGNI